jgi:serine/threonine protein phosphatase PrpC
VRKRVKHRKPKPKTIVLQGNVGDSWSVASVQGVVEQLSYDLKPCSTTPHTLATDRESPTLLCNTIALGL